MTDPSATWEAQTSLFHPHTRHRQSGSKFGGHDSRQRALVCRAGAEVTGDEMSTAWRAENSTRCGAQRWPNQLNRRTQPQRCQSGRAHTAKVGTQSLSPGPGVRQGDVFRGWARPASSAGRIIYRTGRHSCQAEAGGAGNRTVPFAVTKRQGSLLCVCQAFGGRPLTLTRQSCMTVPTSHARSQGRMELFPHRSPRK